MNINIYQHKYISDIQVLRGLAVLLVVLYHSYPSQFPGGYLGVDIFFVISGYLVGGALFRNVIRNQFSFKIFILKRITRLFPAFFAMLLLSVSIEIGTMLFFRRSFVLDVLSALTNVSNIRFYKNTDYFNSTPNILLHTWSLSVEWQFYVIFPILLLSIRKISKSLKLLMASILTVFLISILGFSLVKNHEQAIFYLLPFRFWEFIIGILSFEKKTKLSPIFHYTLLPVLFGAAFNVNLKGFLSNILIVLITAIYLRNSVNKDYGQIETNKILTKISHSIYKLLEHLGKISYSIYLYHLPLAILFIYLFREDNNRFNQVIYILTLYLVSIISFSLIESRKTLIDYKSKNLYVLIMIMILIVTTQIFFTNKFSQKKYIGDEYNIEKLYRTGKCFLESPSDLSIYDECTTYKSQLIWGDSHAASLLSGLPSDYPISQITGTLCPPLVNNLIAVSSQCSKINSAALNFIKRNKPESVIIVANWVNYGTVSNVSKSLIDTLDIIKKSSPDTNVIVIGNFPNWVLPLKDQLNFLYFYRYLDLSKFTAETNSKQFIQRSIYLKNQSALEINRFDKLMKNRLMLNNRSIFFVSPSFYLCKHDECIALFKDPEKSNTVALSSFDKNHLTPEMASNFIKNSSLLEKLNLPDRINHE